VKSRYSQADARAAVDRYGPQHGEAVALRIYTSRLIGADPELVLHGGGNTSVKGPYETLLGDEVEAIFVKGSGWDLDRLEPAGLPAMDLAYLRRLRALDALADEELVNELRTHLFDASAPNPSVETLLHAFLPHRFVDHSHADAVVALTNQPDGEAWVREALGQQVIALPYIMPGLPLAKAVADAYEARPDALGIVLCKHGLFSFGDDARESYERHIELVDRCEGHLRRCIGGRALFTPRYSAPEEPEKLVARVAPMLRGLLAEPVAESVAVLVGQDACVRRRLVMDWRGGPDELAFCASEEARALCRQGPLTPNHMIRTKALPLFVEDPAWQSDEALRAQLAEEVASYRAAYDAYFEEQCRAKGALPTKLDSAPRVVLLPGAGALCFGKTKREARIAGDISEHTLRTKALAQAAGRYEALSASHLFDMEYWSLEQAKLGSASERPLERQVVLVTGGAGAIGVGIGEACAAAGAHVVLADIDAARAESAARALEERHGAGSALGLAMDVTDADSVRGSFDAVCTAYGGVDVVVPNAGIALVAPVAELTSEQVRRLTEVNYLGVVLCIREAARVFRAQGTGGHIVVNSSKNVFAPGADFGAYSASKAAAHQIGKVAALELAELDVRVNLINADAVFSEGEVRSGLWEEVGPGRAKSRGMTLEELPEFYRQRNLLRTRVSGRHVGNAVVFFASNLTPTTGATLPVDGGVAAAFPR